MFKILNSDLKKVVFNENVTKDSIFKYNTGDLFGLNVNSYSIIYPNIDGKSGNLKCQIKVDTVGEFEKPKYMLFKKINNYIIQDMITGKKMFIIANRDDVANIINKMNIDESKINGMSKFYYITEAVLNGNLPILTIDLSKNILDISEEYKISPEKTFIDAIDSYKKIVATNTLPDGEYLKIMQNEIEKRILELVKNQYESSISEAYDLAQMDNAIYDIEKNNKKM